MSPCQSASVERRSIGDNILVAHELVKGCHRRRISSRCAIKAVIMKVFDSVNWNFILHVLYAVEIPDQFIRWIEACVTGANYTINVNGDLEGIYHCSQRSHARVCIAPLSLCDGY